jgi:hypothetical protein
MRISERLIKPFIKKIYWFSPFLWLFMAVLVKGFALNHTYGVSSSSVAITVVSDFCILAIPFVVLAFVGARNIKYTWSLSVALVVSYLCIYLLDTLLLLGLNARLDFRSLNSNGLEWSVVFNFLGERYPVTIAFCMLLSALSHISINHSEKKWEPTRTNIAFLIILSGATYSDIYSKYSFKPDYFIYNSSQDLQNLGADNFIQVHGAYEKVISESLDIPAYDKSIILLVVESLSAVDSKRMGGMYDRLPELDELSKKGVIFNNYYGNHFNSEGGFISMLCGVPPVTYPGFSAFGYRDYPCFTNNVLKHLKKDGFITEFLTTGHLSYVRKGAYMKAVGFDLVRGRVEVPEFESAERFSFAAPADSLLYEEALKKVEIYRKQNQKFFLNLFTVSSHRPYLDPRNRSNSIESVFSYVGSEITNFYNQLEKEGFFKEGILVVVGDHRRMDIVPDEEAEKLGEKARNWVWLSLFGDGLGGRVIEQNISQHTLIANILKIGTGGHPKSTASVAYTNPWDLSMKSRSGIIDLNNKRPIDEDHSDLLTLRHAGYYIRSSGKHPCEKFERVVSDFEKVEGIGVNTYAMKSFDSLTMEEILSKPQVRYPSFDHAISDNLGLLFPSIIHIQAEIKFNINRTVFVNLPTKAPSCLFADGKLVAVSDEAGDRLTALPSAINLPGDQIQHLDFIAELSPFSEIPRIEYQGISGSMVGIDSSIAHCPFGKCG